MGQRRATACVESPESESRHSCFQANQTRVQIEPKKNKESWFRLGPFRLDCYIFAVLPVSLFPSSLSSTAPRPQCPTLIMRFHAQEACGRAVGLFWQITPSRISRPPLSASTTSSLIPSPTSTPIPILSLTAVVPATSLIIPLRLRSYASGADSHPIRLLHHPRRRTSNIGIIRASAVLKTLTD